MNSTQDKTMHYQSPAPDRSWARGLYRALSLLCGAAALALGLLAATLPLDGDSVPGAPVKAAVVAVIPTATPTIAPSATPEPTATVIAALPESVQLEIPNRAQERNLNCELRSATDLAEYYGFVFTWEELFAKVGHDANGDPNVGFVGYSIDDPYGGIYPNGYGVHAEPITRGLQALGVPAVVHSGQTREWLQTQLAAGQPVLVWATAGLDGSRRVEWQTRNGRTVWGVPYEHTFNAVGYDSGGIYLNDPYRGETDYYTWEEFEPSWALLDGMAVTIQE